MEISVDELLSVSTVVSLPMRTRFRGQHVREVMLFRGPQGWSEFGPFPEYGASEFAAWLASAYQAGWVGYGAANRAQIPVNATLPAVSADQVPAVLARFGNYEDIPAVKIKVAETGQQLDDDLARIAATQALAPQAALRVDANGGWTHAQAVEALTRIAELAGDSLEYAEQPVVGVEPLLAVKTELDRRGIEVRIAADEAIRREDDPLRVAQLGAAEVIVVKAPPLGGVQRALDIVAASGLDAVVSSALDTSVGLTAGLALAAQLPQLPYACGLGTVALFTGDVVSDPLVMRGGVVSVPTSRPETANPRAGADAGLGVGADSGLGAGELVIRAPEPDPELLERYRVTGEREAWWSERVVRAYEVLDRTAIR